MSETTDELSLSLDEKPNENEDSPLELAFESTRIEPVVEEGFKLELESSSPPPAVETGAPVRNSLDEVPAGAFASATQSQDNQQQTSGAAPEAQPESEVGELVFYDQDELAAKKRKLIIFTVCGSVLGSLIWAGIMFMTFGMGSKISLIALAFISSLSARLGADKIKGAYVQIVAAICAGCSVVLGSLFLAFFVATFLTDASEEALNEMLNPSAAMEQYEQEKLENYEDIMMSGFEDYSGEDEIDTEMLRAVMQAEINQITTMSVFLGYFSFWDLIYIAFTMGLAAKLAHEPDF